MGRVSIYAGDNRVTLRRMIDEGVRVHSCVTDPPYGLVSIQKRFGKQGSAAARTENNDGSFARLSGGFMGRAWDGTGIERDPEFWKLIYEILMPGGYVFAFSGARTGHWQAVAMESAGFIMHPMHVWAYGQGFPKAHAADKAIDKLLGFEGRRIPKGAPVKRMIPGADQHRNGSWIKDNGRDYQPGDYLPAADEAVQWSGWAYGTQTQKPAVEPIYLAQKPFSEKNGALNLLKHGVGAVNIDGCRVPLNGDYKSRANGRPSLTGLPDNYDPEVANTSDTKGRHPSNLILDGSPEVVALFPNSKGQQGDVRGTEPSGVTKDIYGEFSGRVPATKRNDSGSSARFFHCFPPDTNPIVYNPKAGKSDRAGSKHPTVKPIALMQYLIRHITPPGGVVLDPFAGSGTTGAAALGENCDCIMMESDAEYVDFLVKRFEKKRGDSLGDGSTTNRAPKRNLKYLLG